MRRDSARDTSSPSSAAMTAARPPATRTRRRITATVSETSLSGELKTATRRRSPLPSGGRGLGHLPALAGLGAGGHPPRVGRLPGHGEAELEVAHLPGRVGDRDELLALRATTDVQQRDAGVALLGDVGDQPLDLPRVEPGGERAAQLRREAARRLSEPGELLLAQARLERRQHEREDHAQRRQGDDEEPERQSVGQRHGRGSIRRWPAGPAPCRGTGSPRRGP